MNSATDIVFGIVILLFLGYWVYRLMIQPWAHRVPWGSIWGNARWVIIVLGALTLISMVIAWKPIPIKNYGIDRSPKPEVFPPENTGKPLIVDQDGDEWVTLLPGEILVANITNVRFETPGAIQVSSDIEQNPNVWEFSNGACWGKVASSEINPRKWMKIGENAHMNFDQPMIAFRSPTPTKIAFYHSVVK